MKRKDVFDRWLVSLASNDPELFAELTARRNRLATDPQSVLVLEAAAAASPGGGADDIVIETIVRQGRPAFFIQNDRVTYPDTPTEAAAETIVNRLKATSAVLERVIPLVGRIDVANYPGNVDYVGTGWLVDRDIVVTNRHVAELLATPDGAQYRFRPGRFGDPMAVSLDRWHEHEVAATASVSVRRVIWIEPDPKGADIAFLQVAPVDLPDHVSPFVRLAAIDPSEATDVAVVGYPARASSDAVSDQARMDVVYGRTYDVKRIAPGKTGAQSRGWLTHDCTTLGGNSGSVVVDMQAGTAVALHFAGLYLVENYAIPASTISGYLKRRPWQGTSRPAQPVATLDTSAARAEVQPTAAITQNGITLTIPLVVNVSLGQPRIGDTARAASIDEAALALQRRATVAGVLAVAPGYLIRNGLLSDEECVVVSAAPDCVDAVRAAIPATFEGFPVDVRAASVVTQAASLATEAVTSISYNDEDRTGEGFSFEWVEEEMDVMLHVGPERSWEVLKEFLSQAKTRLVSSIYEFHAKHIAKAIEERLDAGVEMRLVMATQTHDPKDGSMEDGDFDRAATFERWHERFASRFERVYVPLGSHGLVANAYHIKVTVRDEGKAAAVWLSSGNWKRSSQPVIAAGDLDNPKVTTNAGNREWHVVINNRTLADRFRNHIEADFEQSLALGGTPEAAAPDLFVDVPIGLLEGIELEAAAKRTLPPKQVSGIIRVKPLLTPDDEGAVFSNAVLKLVRSAKRQLLFQNQYVRAAAADAGFLKQLVDALVDRAKKIDDFRMILRSEDRQLIEDVSVLKRRGVKLDRIRKVSNTHTKGIIVDGRRVLLGSHNWSGAGVTLNRDASLVFENDDIAQYYAEAFELDWARARPIVFEESPVHEAPRLAAGDQPPPGFKRIPLAEYLEG